MLDAIDIWKMLDDAKGGYTTLSTGLDNELNQLTAQLAQKVNHVSVLSFGADNTGLTDSTQSIKDALSFASETGNTVVLPSGKYRTSETIRIPEGIRVAGLSTPHIWKVKNVGSIIQYYGKGVAVQMGDDSHNYSGLGIENVRIEDMTGAGDVGLQVGGVNYWLHDIDMHQVTTVGFNHGFKIEKAYAINANLCKSNAARVNGWHLTAQEGNLTLSAFTSCGDSCPILV